MLCKTLVPILSLIGIHSVAVAQQCIGGPIAGTVNDVTSALIAHASVSLENGVSEETNDRGSFRFACVANGQHVLRVSASSFAATAEKVTVWSSAGATLNITLRPETVDTTVSAVDAPSTAVDSEEAAGAKTLNKQDLAQLADDPDDFQRELQTLAAAAGGTPGQAIITVDGFQNASRMPPKSSIAFVRLNPDLFSAEYERPPYRGGRIEVYTKPGADKIHGSLFANTSDVWMNARDPFATSRAAIGKQRFGFDLSGPLVKKKADFSLSLEHRAINEFATVDAVTLDTAGDQQTVIANVPTPQHLWIGNANVSWQLHAKNLLTMSYTANYNSLENLGAGGISLEENGYDSTQGESTIRATDITTVSPRLVHEARASLSWKTQNDTPNSTAPQVEVAGAFTSGGAGAQGLHTRELATEIDDDVIYSHGKHMVKAGVQLLNLAENQQLPQNFNGTYVFGGGLAPELDSSGQSISGTSILISGLEQYRRAQLGLAGGAPTVYSVTTGLPAVDFNLFRGAYFIEDQWKLRPRLQIASGLRYALQTAPGSYANFAPRVGVSWSPDKKQTWVLRARTGLFSTTTDSSVVSETLRLNSREQTQSTVYLPSSFAHPLQGATAITTTKSFAPSISQTPSLQSHLGIEHEFAHHWHAQGNLYLAHAWDVMRTRNINTPFNGSPTGPRPITPDQDILQFQQSGHLGGNVLFVGIDQHSYRRFQIFAGYVRMDLRSNADDATTAPQSAFTDVGEYARPSWQQTHRIIALGSLQLPEKLSLTGNADASSGSPYNVVTGFDNNGDGDFNDRPAYAIPGAPGAIATRYGLLTNARGGGVLSRNIGTMPWTVHLDMNLSRSFALDRKSSDHPQTLLVNLRSANLVNHTNVTAVGNTLGSPLFGIPYAADDSRRVELGLRYSF